MRSARDFMLLTPPEQIGITPPLGDEDSLGPDPGHPFIPPAPYLPLIGVPNAQDPKTELRRTRGGRMALLTYTAVDRLMRCMGLNQPWTLLPTENLNDLVEKQSLDVIMLDQRIFQELWRQEERRYQWLKHLK